MRRFVRRLRRLLDRPEVEVTVLPQQLLQLQPVLDLLPEDLQHARTGRGPGAHVAARERARRSLAGLVSSLLEAEGREGGGGRGRRVGTEHRPGVLEWNQLLFGCVY